MSNSKEFKRQWLDCVVEGQPIREWYQCVKGDTRKARCTICETLIKFDVNGLKTFRRHALSNKHRHNRKLAQQANKDRSNKHQKSRISGNALGVLYPGMNFNCSVNLLPLRFLYKASQNANLLSLLRGFVKPEAKTTFIEIYICFFCGEEFTSRLILQNHQKECFLKQPEFQAINPLGKVAANNHDISHFPSPLTRKSSFTPTKQQINSRSLSSKDEFISSLGLLPKKKAAQICKKRRNTECESIDLDEDIPISPTMSRSPKLLISHLSRDGNENVGDNQSPSKLRRSLFCSQQSRSDKEINDKTGKVDDNKKEENQSQDRSEMTHAKSLYNLDLTSPLGQFVIKHIKGDPHLHVLSDVESHCLTSSPKKTVPAIKLRERHVTYAVTFKGLSGKFSSSYVHMYKFTHRQRREFMRRVNTGLDRTSRSLLRKMKPCEVRLNYLTKADLKRWMASKNVLVVDLKPLTAKEIAYWTSPKEAVDTNTSAIFPSGLTFSSPNVKNVLGLKTCLDSSASKRFPLSVANYVSEETFAEVTSNRRAVYTSLLSDSHASESSSPEIEPLSHSVTKLRQMPPSSSHQAKSQRQAQTPPDNRNTSSSPLSQISGRSNEGGASGRGIDIARHRKNMLVSTPAKGSAVPDRTVSMKNNHLGTVSSDIHTVQVRTALEGESIQTSVMKLRSAPKHNLRNVFKIDQVEKTPACNKLKQAHLLNSQKKRQKISSTLKVKRRKLEDIGKIEPFISLSHSLNSAEETPLVKEVDGTTKLTKDSLHISQGCSLHEFPERQQNVSLKISPGSSVYDNSVHLLSGQGEPTELIKSVDQPVHVNAVDYHRNKNIEKLKTRHRAQLKRRPEKCIYVKSHDGLKVTFSEHPVSSPELFDKRIAKITVSNSSFISNKNFPEQTDFRNTENQRAVSHISKKHTQNSRTAVHKSFVKTNISNSTLSTQKDSSPAALKFVTYSSPVSLQLRQSSLMNTMSIARKAEVRKSLLSSFLLMPNGQTFSHKKKKLDAKGTKQCRKS